MLVSITFLQPYLPIITCMKSYASFIKCTMLCFYVLRALTNTALSRINQQVVARDNDLILYAEALETFYPQTKNPYNDENK